MEEQKRKKRGTSTSRDRHQHAPAVSSATVDQMRTVWSSEAEAKLDGSLGCHETSLTMPWCPLSFSSSSWDCRCHRYTMPSGGGETERTGSWSGPRHASHDPPFLPRPTFAATGNKAFVGAAKARADGKAALLMTDIAVDDGSCIEVVHFDFLGRAPRAVAAETVNLEHHSENVPACRSVSSPCFPG